VLFQQQVEHKPGAVGIALGAGQKTAIFLGAGFVQGQLQLKFKITPGVFSRAVQF